LSEVKTNKLTGTSTAGSIVVTGEGNSTTTNLQQGLVKAWFQIDAASGVLDDSFNYSSSSDNGTGSFSQTFTNNMANQNYSFVAMPGHDDNTEPGATMANMHKALTSGTRVRIANHAGSLVDEQECNGMSAGDLA
jgi:hypothetical protein